MSTPIALEVGTLIGAYKIQKVLATTPFGVLYRAASGASDRVVAIQEFLPLELAQRRRSSAEVRTHNGKETAFEAALTLFLQEARTLSQIHDPYVARVHEYTENNGTAYLVMEYNSGRDLAVHLSKHPHSLEESELRNILVPILKGLRAVHNAKLLHRDITPKAIFLRQEGPPLLTWFGACHRAPQFESSLNYRVSPGYSPIEFYHEEANLEPASDLYSLGAVMYRCISGSTPVDPTQRLAALAQEQEDPLVPAMEIGSGNYSSAFLGIIDWMLQPMLHDRPDSAGAVLGPLSQANKPKVTTTRQVTNRPDPIITRPGPRTPPPVKHTSRPRFRVWSIAVAVPLVVLLLAWLMLGPMSTDPRTSIQHDVSQQDPGPNQDTQPAPNDNEQIVLEQQQDQAVSDAPLADTTQASTENMGDPALQDPPPQIPDKVVFSRSGDEQRAQLYREIHRKEQEKEQLLSQARNYVADGDEVLALEKLQQVLFLDANNADAKQVIAQIADQFLAQAKQALSENDIPRTESLLARIREIAPNHFALAPLEEQLAAHKAELERLEEQKRQAELQQQNAITELLQKGASAVAGGRYIEPQGNNALEHYRAVLKLDPKNQAAEAGIEKVAMMYLEQANRALASDDYGRAATHLITAAAIQPDNPAIGLLREQIDARREAKRKQRLQAPPPTAVAVPSRAPATAPTTVPAVKQISREEQKAHEIEQDLRRGIEAYYAGSYDKARRLLSTLAESGHARAQFRLGMMYYLGRGVVENRAIAEDWVKKALPEVRRLAQQGAAWAQADLGSLYEDGLVLEPNSERAVFWYRRAAEKGYAGAQTNLGVMYANGIGVEANTEEAIRWLERAAAQGDRVARANLLTLRNQQQ